jgi:hypothetical protein
VARILILGGGCRGRELAELMTGRGHAVRISTRSEQGRAAIEASGAECWIGTPDRLATMRGALENVTVACWMLACARGSEQELAPLHSSRLQFFLSQAIDTTARGLIYDAAALPDESGCPPEQSGRPPEQPGHPPAAMLAAGAELFRSMTKLNAIPAVVLGEGRPDGARALDRQAWLDAAVAAVEELLGGSR